MSILNFSAPSEGYVLNFGVEDTTEYTVFKRVVDLDYSLFPVIYIEFVRNYDESLPTLRYLKSVVTDTSTGKRLARSSTRAMQDTEDKVYSLLIDLTEHRDKSLEIVLELYYQLPEELKDMNKIENISNFKIYLGRDNDYTN